MYQQYFGLHELPFELTPNPKFLYLTPGTGRRSARCTTACRRQIDDGSDRRSRDRKDHVSFARCSIGDMPRAFVGSISNNPS